MKLLTSLAVALPLVSARRLAPRGEVVSYDGYKVVRVDTHTDVEAVEGKIASLHTVNFNPGTSNHLDLAVGPEDVETFEALGLDYKVVHEDLGADIKLEGSLKPYSGKDDACPAELPHMDWFDSYHPYEDHLDFIKDLHLAFPKNSEIVHVGESYEGRDIVGIHFWGEGGRGSKPAVYWHGTVHAREWITTMTVEYIAYQLIKGFLSEDEEVQKYVNDYDFYIIPVVNPDGFVHSQTTDRMWRKNRQPRCNETCVGTDLNRNWPHLWDTPGGASTDPCAQSYRGLAPGDTPEMRAFVKFTDKVAAASAGGIKLFIDWHAYGQLILLPYGGNCSAQIDNYDRQMELAGSTAEAIEAVHGSAHVFGPVCDVLYAASGGSMDYVFDVAGAELAWAMELRPGSAAGGGFVLPADQILPTAEENWAGMRYLLKTM